MARNPDLSGKLLRAEGQAEAANVDRLIAELQKMRRRERTRRRQMIAVTAALWLGVLLGWVLNWPLGGPGKLIESGRQVDTLHLSLATAAEFLPLAAIFSTFFLLMRWRLFSIKEISLRLGLIEARLPQQEAEKPNPPAGRKME